MKIVLISFFYPEYTILLANALSKMEHIILIISQTIVDSYTTMISKKIELYTVATPRIRNPSNFKMVYSLIRKIRSCNPDVLHFQAGHPWIHLCLPFFKKKLPVIGTIHDIKCHAGDRISQMMPLRDMAIKHSKYYIVHGNRLKEQLINSYSIEKDRVAVIPHGELSLYKQYNKNDCQEDKFSVLFFGRIWEYKGLRYLIEAEPIISEQVPEVKFIIAGTGEDFKKYEKMMINKNRFVIHNHYISNELTAELFQRASIVVLPYIDGSQSGVVPIAYSFKKPVVATNVGSIPEVVFEGKTGFVVPPADSKALAAAIISLLKEDKLREQFGNNAYNMTKEELSWDNIAPKTIQVYKKACDKFC